VSGPPLFVGAAEAGDADAMAALERRCHTHPWAPRHFHHALRDPTQRVVVAREVERGQPPRIVGYCVVLLAADEAQVHNLAVEPEWRRRGLGRRLLESGLRAAAREGAEKAFLEVRVSNREAIALYRSVGFEPLGERRDYYDDPREDALLLRREGLRERSGDGPWNS
jgi:ribosomal-protein-alanine N-acetyltransferase